MKQEPSQAYPGEIHHANGFTTVHRPVRGMHELTDTGIRISLGIVIVLLLVFAVSVQKSARSMARENHLLVEQLQQLESDRIRLKTELELALRRTGQER